MLRKSEQIKQPLTRKKSPLRVTSDVSSSTDNGNRPRSTSAGGGTMPSDPGRLNDHDLSHSTDDMKGTLESDTHSSSVSAVNGGSDPQLDEIDGHMTSASDPARTKAALDHLQLKIKKTKEAIKSEQTAKEQNVNEYLKLASGSADDKQQSQRIKQMFEKKNQKSTQTIAQLQKKLEQYLKRAKDIEQGVVPPQRHAKDVLKDVGQGFKGVGANIRDGITGFSGGVVGNIKGAAETIVSKPKELAHHLLKKKYGSADNIAALKSDNIGDDSEGFTHQQNSGNTLPSDFRFTKSDDEVSSIISGSDPASATHSSPHNTLNVQQTLAIPAVELQLIHQALHDINDSQKTIREDVQKLKVEIQEKLDTFDKRLQEQQFTFTKQEEERYRFDRLEEQMNDLTELHQHEVTNIKQEISSMEEKMEYQLEERTRDMQELLENCSTRISKMELQQQQQQLISMEGVDNANARALITKLINVVLALLAVILVFVSTVANLVSPFLITRFRILSTIGLVIFAVLLAKNWQAIEFVCKQILDRYGVITAQQ